MQPDNVDFKNSIISQNRQACGALKVGEFKFSSLFVQLFDESMDGGLETL